ncbi:4-hydroxythreonine-4-phosphate dehydrogenase PdxA [Bdellovibrionota bacterium]
MAIFHDQLLPAIKLYAYSESVNVTLGLPFIRTSVDHGVAYDLYGKNIANPASMLEAIRLAINLTKNRT